MAAILTPPATHHPVRPPRPRLLVVPATTGRAVRPVAVSVPATPSPAMLAGVVAAVLAAAVLALLVSHGAFASLVPAAPGRAGAVATLPADGPSVTVETGDTLWSIARDLQPTGDVRPLVDRLVEVNGSSVIVPGQELVVPQ